MYKGIIWPEDRGRMNIAMVNSMTGYGRGEQVTKDARVTVEVRSVNHRYKDISIKMPRCLSFLEERVREYVQQRISRGRVDVYVSFELLEDKGVEIKLDKELALIYLNAVNEIKAITGIDDKVSLDLIAAFPDVITTRKVEPDEEKTWEQLSGALEQAIEVMLEMRKREGQNLCKDILSKLELINEGLQRIKERAALVVFEYQQKLEKRIEEMTKDIELDRDRLCQEVVIFADRSNIDEEIVRLSSHISQTNSTLARGGIIGRKLDFLVQEMHREINTIGSKSTDLDISLNVVEIKTELEKVREQVQNIE
jgi:uncharacterized protein (TIGR00255 family)